MAYFQETEYKGKPTLTLTRTVDDKYPYSFGLAKAKLILECLPAIEAFILKYSQSDSADSSTPQPIPSR
jgi:hypothetical protein